MYKITRDGETVAMTEAPSYVRRAENGCFTLCQEAEAAGIRHYQAPLNQRSVTAMSRARRILRQVIEREKPDVVHAHARIPAFLCGILRRRMKFAFVTSCHGVYQVSGALKLLSNWGEHTLAVSEDIRDYLMKQYGLPVDRITLTINGIDTEKFSPVVSGTGIRAELGLGDAPVVGHVSRLPADCHRPPAGRASAGGAHSDYRRRRRL